MDNHIVVPFFTPGFLIRCRSLRWTPSMAVSLGAVRPEMVPLVRKVIQPLNLSLVLPAGAPPKPVCLGGIFPSESHPKPANG